MLTSGFFNSLGHDRLYDALQMSSIFDGVIADGILGTVGNAFVVTKDTNSARTVHVGTGRAWFNHTWTLNDTLYPLVIEASSPINPRIDCIALEINRSTEVRENRLVVIKGEYTGVTANRPTLVHNEYVDQYALAYINVIANTAEITQGDIINVIGTETPFVSALIETIPIATLLQRYDYEISHLEETQAAEFREWFAHLQNELDSNQAANLQHQIDNITNKIKAVPLENIDALFN